MSESIQESDKVSRQINHYIICYDVIIASSGDEVAPFYDPMIAKLVVWNQDRSSALRLLENALSQYQVTDCCRSKEHIICLHLTGCATNCVG